MTTEASGPVPIKCSINEWANHGWRPYRGAPAEADICAVFLCFLGRYRHAD